MFRHGRGSIRRASAPAPRFSIGRRPGSTMLPGMALLTALSLDSARALMADYDLAAATLEPLHQGSVNSNFRFSTEDGRIFFARIYEEQDLNGALAELRLVNELARVGVPVAQALPRANGALVHSIGGKPFAVYPWVQGDILCQRRVTPAATDRVGRALASLHLATPRLTRLGAGRFGPEQLYDRLSQVEARGDETLKQAATAIRAKYAFYLPKRDPNVPHGVIHGDLFRDNVLWQNDEIAALIDFESASEGPYVYDLAVTLLAWCYSDHLEPELCRAMLAAYHELRPLTDPELTELPIEAALACLRFATTRMTDYSLRTPPGGTPGRDFRRFLSRLSDVEAGVLARVVETLRKGNVGAIT